MDVIVFRCNKNLYNVQIFNNLNIVLFELTVSDSIQQQSLLIQAIPGPSDPRRNVCFDVQIGRAMVARDLDYIRRLHRDSRWLHIP